MWSKFHRSNEHIEAAKAEREDSERRLDSARTIIDSLNQIRESNHFAQAIESTFRNSQHSGDDPK